MSKKSNVENCPKFEDSDLSLRFIRLAAEELRRKGILSLTRQAQVLSEWSLHNARNLETDPFCLTKQRWSEFVKREDGYRTVEPGLTKVAWYWLFSEYHATVEPVYQSVIADVGVPNMVVPSLHSLISPDVAKMDVTRLQRLSGNYRLYRPHYLDPDKIMEMTMACGEQGDISRFHIDMSYDDETGSEVSERVDGYALPYGDSVLFQGALRGVGAPFIFVLTRFQTVAAGREVRRGEGTLLVGSNGGLPSSYPILMRRVEALEEPRVVTTTALKKEKGGAEVLEILSGRGLVSWRR